ncbi:MAG: hypothetical protein LBM61_03175 [Prevotellaceae bacterium]|jgi:hypothetical protein|nr:hypothetical protein [Prevotellaceae bacterium]
MKTEKELAEFKCKVSEGLHLAYQKLVEKTKKEGGELVVMRDGKVVRIKPE